MARADASTGKITLDRTRPLIENKRVIDRLVFESISKEDAVVPCLQITGIYEKVGFHIKIILIL